MEQIIAKAIKVLDEAHKILVFTGAGISTDSGVPDFRSPGGIWDRYDPSEFYLDKIISSVTSRENYWKMSSDYYKLMLKAVPNAAHLALKKLEDRGKLLAIVTQNIDNLHQKAGNSPEKVIEIHGTASHVICLNCGKKYDRDVIEKRILMGEKAPACERCAGVLKPATISFGQSMPQDKMIEAIRYAKECDLCLVLGSSLTVYPAASVPEHAVSNGALLIIINREATPLDSNADLVIQDSLANTLSKIIQ